ncbi:hypothetical protein CPB84DRAFT_875427 [Gymnopilus junonius]|uniref:F-box domain-containing protein n=1 Tax=Gymnopilus junonius TaxID=109634 RepID=A0A9P5NPP7_GYMJU|nr:hypothetical protein CPB84DRAFT_875427 [Gymnopilus junonius]
MRRCDNCGSLNSSLDEGDLCNIYNGVPCATCKQLSLLNLQIAEAKDHMEKLLHERRRMKSERNRDHDLLNACLPPEITARIFELYVAPTSEPNHSKRVPSSPMILVAVCQAWRDLAERTPSLWVSVRINLTKDTKDASLQTLTRHIRCSGSHHLFIQIRLLEDETRTNADIGAIYAAFLDTLSTCSKRWQVLDCDITKEFWERLRLCLCAGTDPIEAPGIVAPFLQTLRLYSLRGDILTEEDVFSRGLLDVTAVPQFNPTHSAIYVSKMLLIYSVQLSK